MLRFYVLAAVAGMLTTFSSSQAATLAQWDFEQYSDGSTIPLGLEVVPESAWIMDVSGNGRHLSKPQFIAIPSSTVEGMNGGVAHQFSGHCNWDFGECDFLEYDPIATGTTDIDFGKGAFTVEAIALFPQRTATEMGVSPSYRLGEGGLVGRGTTISTTQWNLNSVGPRDGQNNTLIESFFGTGANHGSTPGGTENIEWLRNSVEPLASGWHHVAAVRDTTAAEFRLYFDGELVATKADVPGGLDLPSIAGHKIVVGTRDSYGNHYRMYSNAIDEIRISDEALSCGDFLNPCEITVTGVPGDYNESGSVDTADYTTWRDMLGQNVTPGTGPDGVQDGTID